MDNLPERPSNPHAHLRASDEDRDRVVDVLRESLMAGRLTHDEHAERLEATFMAKTLGELEPITADLVIPEQAARPGAHASTQIEPAADPDASFESVVGIFGGGERKGRWRVKRRTNAICIFGGYDFDMTDAVFEAKEVTLWTFALFGGIDVTVPDNVEVRTEGMGIFGGFGATGSENPDPKAPVVVLKGLAIFGGVGGRTSGRRHGKKKKGHLDH
jgi:hypothetical protein